MKIKILLSTTDYNGFGGYYGYLIPNTRYYLNIHSINVNEFVNEMLNIDNLFFENILNHINEVSYLVDSLGLFQIGYESPYLTEDFCLYLVMKGFMRKSHVIGVDYDK